MSERKRQKRSADGYMLGREKPKTCPDWSDLPFDVLDLVASKLCFLDVPCFNEVCSSWFAASRKRNSSLSPLLMIPSMNNNDEAEGLDFFYLRDMNNTVYALTNSSKIPGRLLDNGRCVGSSHGWLFVLDKEANPFLLNPFSGREIQLPTRETFPHIDTIKRVDDRGNLLIQYKNDYKKELHPTIWHVKCFQECLVQKAILSVNPSYTDDFKVFIIYGYPPKLAFCNNRDKAWKSISTSNNFLDVAWQGDTLYSLQCMHTGLEIGVWDCSLASKLQSFTALPSLTLEPEDDIRFSYCTTKHYIIPTMEGEIYVIVRFIGDMVNGDEVVEEVDLLWENDTQPLVCPYRTLGFKVYKLDENQKGLIGVKSLDDRIMFLGGNHSMLIPAAQYGMKRDAIYFTDDYWDRNEEDYLYGGHDIGVYSLQDKCIDLHCDVRQYKPVPFWVFPGSQ